MSALMVTASFDAHGQMLSAVIHRAGPGQIQRAREILEIEGCNPDEIDHYDSVMADQFVEDNRMVWLGPEGTGFAE